MVNGQVIEEPYVADFSVGECDIDFPYQVPQGKYFVLGDNRLNSRDSRIFGFIDEEDILGKVSLRYWPLNSFGTVE